MMMDIFASIHQMSFLKSDHGHFYRLESDISSPKMNQEQSIENPIKLNNFFFLVSFCFVTVLHISRCLTNLIRNFI